MYFVFIKVENKVGFVSVNVFFSGVIVDNIGNLYELWFFLDIRMKFMDLK